VILLMEVEDDEEQDLKPSKDRVDTSSSLLKNPPVALLLDEINHYSQGDSPHTSIHVALLGTSEEHLVTCSYSYQSATKTWSEPIDDLSNHTRRTNVGEIHPPAYRTHKKDQYGGTATYQECEACPGQLTKG